MGVYYFKGLFSTSNSRYTSYANLAIQATFPSEFTQITQALSTPKTSLTLNITLLRSPLTQDQIASCQTYLTTQSMTPSSTYCTQHAYNNSLNFSISAPSLEQSIAGTFQNIADIHNHPITSARQGIYVSLGSNEDYTCTPLQFNIRITTVNSITKKTLEQKTFGPYPFYDNKTNHENYNDFITLISQ